MLGVLKEGPVLALFDKNGKTRVGLSVLRDSPVLWLLDENEKSRVRADHGHGQELRPSYPLERRDLRPPRIPVHQDGRQDPRLDLSGFPVGGLSEFLSGCPEDLHERG